MALTVLSFIIFTATLFVNHVTSPKLLLDNKKGSQKHVMVHFYGSIHPRLKTVDVYRQNLVASSRSGKTINRSDKDISNKTITLPSYTESLKHCINRSTSVTDKDLSHYNSLFAERNVTNTSVSHHNSIITGVDATEKRFSHSIKKVKEKIAINDNLSHNSVLPRQITSVQTQFTNTDTSTAAINAYTTISGKYLSRLHSHVSQERRFKSFSTSHRKFGLRSIGHRQKRFLTTKVARANIHQLRYRVTNGLATHLSSISSNNYGHNSVTMQARAVNNNNFYRECSCERTKCDCSLRYFESIPQDLPTSITELLLGENDIETLPANIFSRYSLLEYLDMHHNLLSALGDGSFNGLPHLRDLDIHANGIRSYTSINQLTFKPLMSLKVLRLNLNIYSCQSLPPFLDVGLSYLHNLEELHIDNYIDPDSEDNFGPGFSNLTLLRKLSFSCDCSMESLWNTTFVNFAQITSLDISNCDINGLYIEAETFTHLPNLLTLDISQNHNIGMEHLPVILWGLRSSGLQSLRMNNIVNKYSLNFINISVIQYLPQSLTALVARGNNIMSINPESIKKLPKSLKTIDVSENYLIMNPEDIPLESMEGLETLLIHSSIDECLRSDDNYFAQPSRDASNFEINVHGQQKHTRGDGVEQKLGIVIPRRLKRVQVNVDGMHNDFMLDIDDRNDIEELDISCSYIPRFDFNSFLHLHKLRFINARKSSVHWINMPDTKMKSLNILSLGSNDLSDYITSQRGLFARFYNLSYLDLSNNQITHIIEHFFDGLDNLEYLRLEDNPISHFDATISNLPHLKIFNLSRTELSHLPSDVRSHIDLLCKERPGQILVDMTGCPVQCDCFNLDFLKWMVSSAAFDSNFTGYKCKYPDTTFKYIFDGYQETIRVLDRECAKNYPMFLIVLAGTSVLLLAVIGAILYRLRWKIRYLYYAAYLKFMDKHKNDNNHEFTYDVFVSYDSEDQAFVTRSLSPELEDRGLKLLIHTRDFVAGTFITSNIVMAVTESRKTLVVLTRNLLESTWCNFELQMATMEAVHTGRQVLVFLLKEDIPNRELDVELLGHIRSNTYLPYPAPEEEGDEDIMKRFYDKLAHDLRC